MSRRWEIVLSLLVSSVVAGCWFRGPLFFLPFLFLAFPLALVIVAPLFWLRVPLRLSVVIVWAVGVLMSYFVCAPPTTGQLFARHLGLSIPSDVSDLRRWNDNWARDPGYYLRFHTSEDTVLRIVKRARLTEDSPWKSPPPSPPRFLLSVPGWWKPAEIENLRTWKGWDTRGEFWVNLYFDTQSGLVYLEVLST
jgi:hypothetical protein